MKKLTLVFIMILIGCLCFTGCGKKDSSSDASSNSGETSSSQSSSASQNNNGSQGGSTAKDDSKSDGFKSPGSDDDSGVVEIKEKMFLTQITDIYANFNDYKDKKVKVEGMFTYFKDNDGQPTIPVVYRKGPGCCGNDGWGGFLLDMPKDIKIPKDNDWIIVTGSPLREYDDQGAVSLHLKVDSLKVSDKRGAEFVKQ